MLDAAPLAPMLLDLRADDDSGAYADDDLTNVTTPTLDIVAAEEGDTVRVYREGTLLGDAAPLAGRVYQYEFAEGELIEGANTITARAYDGMEESGDSSALVVTVDTTGPHATFDGPGGALLFDGSNDYVEIAHAPSIDFGTSDFTVELWVNWNSFSGEQVLIEKWSESPFVGWTLTKLPNNVLHVATAGPSVNISADLPDLEVNVWHHVALTRCVNEFALYWDGEPIGSGTSPVDVSSPQQLLIGRRGDSRGFFFNGLMDDVRLWSVARTQQEIQSDMYDALSGIEPDLTAYWGFDEGWGTTVRDITGNGHEGLLGGDAPTARPTWTFSTAPPQPDAPDIRHLPISENWIVFDEPIDTTSSTVQDVHILSPAGDIDETVTTLAPGSNGYRISYPEQTADGVYSLSVAPEVYDLAGNSMNEFCYIEFALSVGPRIISAGPGQAVNLRMETFDSVTVEFDEPIDYQPDGGGTFDLNDVLIVGPDGEITPTGIRYLPGNEYAIDFAPQTRRGRYTFTVGSEIADPSGALMDQDQDGLQGEIEEDAFTFSLCAFDADTIFTSETTIIEEDTSYDGQDIVVNATTVVIDGEHGFNSVFIINGGTLTHSACTDITTHSLGLAVADTLVVDSTSKIDVSGKGYLPGYTTGNTTDGAATIHSGGSYGGLGNNGNTGQSNAVYDDYADPNDWGSGGGRD